MKNNTVILVLVIVFSSLRMNAQSVSLYRDTSIHVFDGNLQLVNAWAGGFNIPVFAQIDLNGDGRMDLVVFDAQGYRLSTFINKGTPNKIDYIYAPEYEKRFPPNLEGWIRTYDYDGDGDMDLFSYTNASINVFRNDYNPQTGLHFTLISNQLNTYYGTFATNIYVSRVDMPAFVDDNGDGDMDVLSLDIGQGYIHHEKNLSWDSLGVKDQFLFHDIDGCWGYFSFEVNSNYAYLPNPSVPNGCNLSLPANPLKIDSPVRHNGSATWAMDMDGDGDQDLLFGSIHRSNLLYMQNCGTKDSAYMCAQDTFLFPSYAAVDAGMDTVASPYYMDVNNDGNKDLLVANFGSPGEDYYNVKYFRNSTNNSSNVFSYVTDRFLVDNMIEVGTGAHPALVDVDGDGLKDLLISNDYYFNRNGRSCGKIKYYHNTGTSTAAKFTLVTDDFAGLSADSLTGIYLTFGDIDNDGDLDMIVGISDGTLDYFQNNGGVYTLTQTNYQSITVSHNAIPQLVDVDRDGKLDLLIGKRTGSISYYRNTGTLSNPVFTFVTDTLGSVMVTKYNSYAGFSVPVLYDNNGSYEMLVGSLSGYIYHYTNIDNNLTGAFTLADSMFQNIYEPQNATPAMADLDGDGKFDLVIGNIDGGLVYYSQNSFLSVDENSSSGVLFTLYPNPANEVLNIRTGNLNNQQKAKATIYDVLGKKIMDVESLQEMFHLDLRGFTPGIYLCKLTVGDKSFCLRFVKQ